jgi:hypothetical protein
MALESFTIYSFFHRYMWVCDGSGRHQLIDLCGHMSEEKEKKKRLLRLRSFL